MTNNNLLYVKSFNISTNGLLAIIVDPTHDLLLIGKFNFCYRPFKTTKSIKKLHSCYMDCLTGASYWVSHVRRNVDIAISWLTHTQADHKHTTTCEKRKNALLFIRRYSEKTKVLIAKRNSKHIIATLLRWKSRKGASVSSIHNHGSSMFFTLIIYQ